VTWFHRDINVSEYLGEFTIIRHPSRGFVALAKKLGLGFWLVGWTVGEYDAGRLLAFGLPYKSLPNARLDPFMWLWFVFWSIGGLAAAFALYIELFARPETVILRGDEIVASCRVGHWARTNSWPIRKIAAMRLRELGTRRPLCLIEFGYEGKTLALIPPSDRISTERILDEIRNHVNKSEITLIRMSRSTCFSDYSTKPEDLRVAGS